jgi:outer membrane protein assembly factor BamB
MKSSLPYCLLVLWAVTPAAPAEDWPCFRGPTGQGVSTETNLPLHWSDKENVAWVADVPGLGWSSPIVQGDRVFVTTATDKGTSGHVLCLERTSGKILWDKEVFQQTPLKIREKNSHATPTPVADGERVYAVFGSGGMAALDYRGEVVWTNQDVKFSSVHGLGSSPLLYGDLLVMPFDGTSPEDGTIGWQKPWDQAFLLAVDKKTGKERWRGKRGSSRLSHMTPLVVPVDGKDQIVSAAGDAVQGFDPKTGERLWTVYSEGEGVTPSPIYDEGLLFTSSGFGKPTIRAIRPDGKGDVTKTHVVWEQTKNVSMIPSFAYVKPYLFTVSEKGVAQCLEPASGKVLWEQPRVAAAFCASPVVADGKLYLLSEEAETIILEPKGEYKEVARNPLGEKCQASMAVSHGQLFIRTAAHLYCLGKDGGKK